MPAMLMSMPKVGRKLRQPEHIFDVRAKPYVIQPFMIAPVLPGETLSSLQFQMRSQTEQLVNQFRGWWIEVYFYYVKLSQLDNANSWIGQGGMLMNPEFDITTPTDLTNAANVDTYHEDTAGIDYVKRCRDIVVREWFRDEGEDETSAGGLLDSEPMVHVRHPGWMDSIRLKSALDALAPDLPDDAANATLRELERLQQQWQMLNAVGVTDMSYEDFLGTFGVRAVNPNEKRPELIRWQKFWQLPASQVTVDATSGAGVASAVVSWKVEGGANKDRLFKQHGFITGYVVARPKTLYVRQRSAGVTMLDNAFAWAPKMFDDEFAGITIRDYADGRGPLDATVTEAYSVDTKDLFLKGDQFTNVDISTDTTGLYHTSTTSGSTANDPSGKYTTSGSIDAMFIAANTTNLVRHDGIVRLAIKSALRDSSPQNVGQIVL